MTEKLTLSVPPSQGYQRAQGPVCHRQASRMPSSQVEVAVPCPASWDTLRVTHGRPLGHRGMSWEPRNTQLWPWVAFPSNEAEHSTQADTLLPASSFCSCVLLPWQSGRQSALYPACLSHQIPCAVTWSSRATHQQPDLPQQLEE